MLFIEINVSYGFRDEFLTSCTGSVRLDRQIILKKISLGGPEIVSLHFHSSVAPLISKALAALLSQSQ